MNDLAKKMHEAAAQMIVSGHPNLNAKHALIGALRAVIDHCTESDIHSISVSELRSLLISIGDVSTAAIPIEEPA